MDAKTTKRVEASRRDACGQCCFRCGCGKGCYVVHAPCPCCPGRNFSQDVSVRYYQSKADHISGREREWNFNNTTRQFTLTNINSYGGGQVIFNEATLANVQPHDALLEAFAVSGPCDAVRIFLRGAPVTKVYRVEMT